MYRCQLKNSGPFFRLISIALRPTSSYSCLYLVSPSKIKQTPTNSLHVTHVDLKNIDYQLAERLEQPFPLTCNVRAKFVIEFCVQIGPSRTGLKQFAGYPQIGPDLWPPCAVLYRRRLRIYATFTLHRMVHPSSIKHQFCSVFGP